MPLGGLPFVSYKNVNKEFLILSTKVYFSSIKTTLKTKNYEDFFWIAVGILSD